MARGVAPTETHCMLTEKEHVKHTCNVYKIQITSDIERQGDWVGLPLVTIFNLTEKIIHLKENCTQKMIYF